MSKGGECLFYFNSARYGKDRAGVQNLKGLCPKRRHPSPPNPSAPPPDHGRVARFRGPWDIRFSKPKYSPDTAQTQSGSVCCLHPVARCSQISISLSSGHSAVPACRGNIPSKHRIALPYKSSKAALNTGLTCSREAVPLIC